MNAKANSIPSSAPRTAFRVVVPPCDCCGAGADEQCAADCAERVEFEPASSRNEESNR